MNIESKLSGHWTDEQLIEHLYGVGPEDGHIQQCMDCQARFSAMQANRHAIERAGSSQADVSFEFLAAQRRQIYAKLTEPAHWWSHFELKRWVSAAATVLVAGGGLFLYEQNHKQQMVDNRVSDAQLAQEVSRMAQESEALPTAPLHALFEE
jgi:hypothetical protein